MTNLFTIRRATGQDVDGINFVMEQVKETMSHPQWFMADDRAWIKAHVAGQGFIIVATVKEDGKEKIVAFFIISFPESPENNLGRDFLPPDRLGMVAHMDSVAILASYRGHHLQGKMLEAAERELVFYPYQYLFCTIHPDNHASLHTMQRYGYMIVGTKVNYGGLPRHVLYKKKKNDKRDVRPNILVSACLLGVHCRYDGKGVLEEWLREWMDKANLIPVCPEILGGLATPRDPAERQGEQVMTASGENVTCQYQKGAKETLALAQLFGCHCAVLKERSPSCGHGVIYDGTHTRTLKKGDGITAEYLKVHGITVFGESEEKKLKDFMDDRRNMW